MRTFDLAPLYRSTVGFDRLFSMLDGAGFDSSAPTYPPYNIERTGENAYRISIAVAGFAENELTIESKENTLTVKGEKQEKSEMVSLLTEDQKEMLRNLALGEEKKKGDAKPKSDK